MEVSIKFRGFQLLFLTLSLTPIILLDRINVSLVFWKLITQEMVGLILISSNK